MFIVIVNSPGAFVAASVSDQSGTEQYLRI
jgi:hypothetical protein